MNIKEYHIGKTVPEMIATLEKHDNECRRAVSKAVLPEIIRIADETKNRYVEMTDDARIASYEEIGEYLQVLLRPAKDYETMPNEELIKRYNYRKTHDDIVEFHAAGRRAERASSKKRVDWTRFKNMSNRVKTAVTGFFGSIKKRIGKKNKEDK